MRIIVMGVSGSGKTTVGTLLAQKLGVPYFDGDDLHPQENIDKMAQGIPLNDADRWPWLAQVGGWLAHQPEGGVIGCSALKRSYRDLLREHCPTAVFVHVHGSREVLLARMNHRQGHFMPASLLDSQFATLEPLENDEVGRVFDVTDSPDQIADSASEWIKTRG
ncbi:gluconokinase [Corynebacterium ulcerans]|uniref:gluconokinase n=1 Tax=Corynebacterium ulcerans TaxID=65058 RepID=UPI0018D8F483|nr:gluconokinase [Corynebacterium ulcerans]MBH5295247.1 gluconokinase [Corynebacterium ulcerans]MDK8888531.1 gluconokinase [Corynebacterium ulcerans]